MKKQLFGFLIVGVLAVVGGFNLFGSASVARAYLTCESGGSHDVCGRRECSTVGATGNECDGNGNTVGGFICSGGSWSTCNAITAGGNVGNVQTSLTGLNPVITFSQVVGATGYTLQVSASPTFSPLLVNRNITSNTTRVYPTDNATVGNSPTKLAANTQYYFRVKAFNALGLTSDWSTTFTFRTAATTSVAADVLCPNGTGPYCDFAALAPAGAITTDSIFSLLATTGAQWMTADGRAVTNAKSIHAETRYFDENGKEVFISGASSQNIVNLINNLIGGR